MKHHPLKSLLWRALVLCAALVCAACENTAGPGDGKNSDAAILSFSIGEAVGAISGTDIALWLPPETDKTSLSPEIALSRGASVSPSSGSPRDFSESLTYTVTAEDGGTKNYTVTVRSESSLNPPVFDSVDALADYLLAFGGKNNQDTPINIALRLDVATLEGGSHAINNTSNDWLGAVFDSLNGRYITLDLSACTGAFIETGSAAEIQATIRARRDTDKLLGIVLPPAETDLPDYIFSHIAGLRRARLPAGLKTLGTGVFLDCVSLETIDFDGGLQTIGERAFSGCISLKTEALSALVNTEGPLALGDYAFAGCASLTSLVQANIGDMGRYVFQECVNLASVTISAESIGAGAFYNCTNLNSVAIQDSVRGIGWSAFQNCTSLVSIAIPDSVTALGPEVFSGCTGLETVNLPGSLTSLPSHLFENCAGLAPVSIPDSIRTIGSYAFSGCASLESIAVPATVESIAERAFANCTNLTITLLGFPASIGTDAFLNCVEVVYAASNEEDLVDGVWLDGEIAQAGEVQYYRFPVIAGKWYGVWVNDNGYEGSAGDGTKTLNIGVTATYEDSATPIFSPGPYDVSYVERRYVIPHIFTAASSGNVTLEVAKFSSAANNTGTFAIKYGELKPITAGTVETGTLAAGGLQWYAFVPDPSTMYAVSWEDAGEQAAGSAYTGDVEVTGFQTIRNTTNIAAQSTADPAFNPADNGYKAPRFLLSATGTNANRLQLIRVEAKTGGSYALKLTALTTTPATATPLEAGTAVSDTIAAGEVKLYSSIPYDRSKSYEILWEDAGDQAAGSSYTGDIMVTAYNTTFGLAAAILFDTVDKGYSTPQQATRYQDYYLVVVGKAGVPGGTYSIKCQEQQEQ